MSIRSLPKLALLGAIVMSMALPVSTYAAWTEVSIPGETQRPQDIIYFNSLFVAVGYDAEIITSPDGANWTLRSLLVNPVDPENPEYLAAFRAVASDGSKLVAVGDNGLVASSTDGTTWTVTQEPVEGANGYADIAYGNGVFVVTNFTSSVLVSTDGVEWVEHSVTNDGTVRNIAFLEEEFVAIPSSGDTAYLSENGTSWNGITSNLSGFYFIEAFAFTFDALYAGGRDPSGPAISYATDESGFTSANLDNLPASDAFISGFASDGSVVAAVGGQYSVATYLYVSSDGTNFGLQEPDFSSSSNGIIYANGLWVIIGEGFAAYTDSLSGGGSTPYLVDGATDLGGGWYDTWLGDLNINSWPWVYAGVGWFYAGNAGNSNASSWFFFTNAQLNCWVWASENSAQWVYCQPTGQPLGWWFVDGDSVEGFTYLFGPDGAVIGIQDEF